MDYMLASVAGCTGADVMRMLNKSARKYADLSIDITGKRADTHPMVYTEVDISRLSSGVKTFHQPLSNAPFSCRRKRIALPA